MKKPLYNENRKGFHRKGKNKDKYGSGVSKQLIQKSNPHLIMRVLFRKSTEGFYFC